MRSLSIASLIAGLLLAVGPGSLQAQDAGHSHDAGEREVSEAELRQRVAEHPTSRTFRTPVTQPPSWNPSEVFAGPRPEQGEGSNFGTEFWLVMQKNNTSNWSGDNGMFIDLTSRAVPTSGTVEIPGLGFSQSFDVTPGEITRVQLPDTAEVQANGQVVSKAIHVTAQNPIAVYGLSRIEFTTDGYLGLPERVLSTNYVVASYANSERFIDEEALSQFAVVSPQDGTTVEITPSDTTLGGRPSGQPFTVTLDRGDVYQVWTRVQSGEDLSGSVVQSSAPVAVFGGNSCADIPFDANVGFCDVLHEQLPPPETWGESYVTRPLENRENGDTWRVFSAQDSTTVSIDGTQVATLGFGDYYEAVIEDSSSITTSNPTLVMQYANSDEWDPGIDGNGDPFMMMVPPTEQFENDFTFATPSEGFPLNFASLVVPDTSTGNALVDGSLVPPGDFSPIPNSDFASTALSLTLGTHNVKSTNQSRMGVYSYGFADDDSYGYTGGLRLETISEGTAPVIARTDTTIGLGDEAQPDGQPSPIAADITDPDTPVDSLLATLFYRPVQDSAYVSTSMAQVGPTRWEASIPAAVVDSPGVEYYLSATDGQLTTTSPGTNPQTEPYNISVLPNEPPTIAHDPVTSADGRRPIPVSATVTDSTTTVASVELLYRSAEGNPAYTSVTMTEGSGNAYEGTIPASVVTAGGVEYFIRATDDYGVSATAASADAPFFVAVAASALTYTPTSLSATLSPGDSADVPLTLTNEGDPGSVLQYSFPAFAAMDLLARPGVERNDTTSPLQDASHEKGSDPHAGIGNPVRTGAGGPDAFGYRWIDSNEPGGPSFTWTDITEDGTEVSLGDDDGETVSLPFDFSFYGQTKTEVTIGSNGYLTFGTNAGQFGNDPIPSTDAPNDGLYGFWDDLSPNDGGTVHYRSDAQNGQFVVQYTDVPYFSGPGTSTFQIILREDGSIQYRYLDMDPQQSATVGIENAAGDTGLQVAFNTEYVEDSLAVALSVPPTDFITDVSPAAGSLAVGESQTVSVRFTADDFPSGVFENELSLATDDPDNQGVLIPATMEVGAGATTLPVGCISFEEIATGSSFVFGDVFQSGGYAVEVDNYVLPNDSTIASGSVTVTDALAQKPGKEAAINNATVRVDFPQAKPGVSFAYRDLGGNVNLEVNGDRRNPPVLDSLDGETVGGVPVDVRRVSTSPVRGFVTLRGSVNSVAIGGQEFTLDDVCVGCITFEDLAVSSTVTQGATLTTGGFDVDLEEFTLANGDPAPGDGTLTILQDSLPGFHTGNKGFLNNVVLAPQLPSPPVDSVQFTYNTSGGTLNLRVNGTLEKGITDFAVLDGQTVGGALVSVDSLPSGSGAEAGIVTISGGPIDDVAVGGQELWIDDFCVPGLADEPGNASPTAEVDTFSVPEGQTLTVSAPGVLANDSDPDGDSLTASVLSGPSRGTLVLDGDGSFEYTPAFGVTGEDTFTYQASDPAGATDSASVTLTVLPSDGACPLAWSLQIHASDSVADSSAVTLGQSSGATAGLDPGCGELELPPKPPSDVFDLRFTDTDLPGVTLGQGTRTDIRPNDTATGEPTPDAATSAPAVWRLSLQSNHFPITLTWDPSVLADSLPNTPVRLVDVSTGGTVVDVDMTTTDSITVTNTSITALEVRLDQTITRSVPLLDGWMLASIPLEAPDPTFGALLPPCTSGFFYEPGAGYTSIGADDPVPVGRGFFANCPGGTVPIEGAPPDSSTVGVEAGWGIIGPFADSVDTAAITSDPPGIVQTSFFGFDQGYVAVDTLRPGRGYWVKTSVGGVLNLSGSGTGGPALAAKAAQSAHDRAKAPGTKLVLTDAHGRTATLRLGRDLSDAQLKRHALPPRPPGETFDVRFASGRSAATVPDRPDATDAPSLRDVELQGVRYPVDLRLDGAASQEQALRVVGEGENAIRLTSEQPTATLTTETTQLQVGLPSVPAQFALEKSVPNPATDAATIPYAVPDAAEVTLAVYDVLGRRVARLVNSTKSAGRYQARLDASRLPSGTYFVRMQAGDFRETRRLTIVK